MRALTFVCLLVAGQLCATGVSRADCSESAAIVTDAPTFFVKATASTRSIVLDTTAHLGEAAWSTGSASSGISLSIQIDKMPSEVFALPGGDRNARIVQRFSPIKVGVHSVTIILIENGHTLQRRTFCIDVRS